VAQAVVSLLCKHEAFRSNSILTKIKNKKEKDLFAWGREDGYVRMFSFFFFFLRYWNLNSGPTP
jgi:hypothetical protein